MCIDGEGDFRLDIRVPSSPPLPLHSPVSKFPPGDAILRAQTIWWEGRGGGEVAVRGELGGGGAGLATV